MRYVHLFLCCLMLLFMVVQFNDPDGFLWMAIYAVPAIWTGIAAISPARLSNRPVRHLLLLCLSGALAGIVYYWPKASRWWTADVWYETETAREGMGMMVVFIVLLIVWLSSRGKKSAPEL